MHMPPPATAARSNNEYSMSFIIWTFCFGRGRQDGDRRKQWEHEWIRWDRGTPLCIAHTHIPATWQQTMQHVLHTSCIYMGSSLSLFSVRCLIKPPVCVWHPSPNTACCVSCHQLCTLCLPSYHPLCTHIYGCRACLPDIALSIPSSSFLPMCVLDQDENRSRQDRIGLEQFPDPNWTGTMPWLFLVDERACCLVLPQHPLPIMDSCTPLSMVGPCPNAV